MAPESLMFAAPGNVAATIAAAVFAMMVGSFLNVVIHRLPKMMQRDSDNYVAHESGKELPHQDTYNLMVPRSACPRKRSTRPRCSRRWRRSCATSPSTRNARFW